MLLLLLQQPARRFTPAEVASDLRIDAASAERRLEDLTQRGFGQREDQAYSYKSTARDGDVRALAAAYKERRVAVITLIFTKPDPVRALADAFRINKKGG